MACGELPYNGHVFGTEVARGFDALGFLEGPLLTGHELDAARQSSSTSSTPSTRPGSRGTRVGRWSAPYYDQAVRNGLLDQRIANVVAREIERAMEYEDRGATPLVIAARLQSAARRVGDAAPGLYWASIDLAATYTP